MTCEQAPSSKRKVVVTQRFFDDATMATDHVDCRTAPRAPAFDRAIDHAKIPQAGKLDAIVIAVAADVADAQPA